MTLKTKIFFFSFLFFSLGIFAQKTNVYTDINLTYKNAVSSFHKKEYGKARFLFETVIDQTKNQEIENKHDLVYESSYFYRAVAASKSEDADAEILLKDYLKTFPNSVKRNRADYHLASYYFAQSKYDSALVYYKDMSDINQLTPKERQEYQFRVGYCHFLAKEFKEADRYFASIKEIKNKYYYPANYYHAYIAYENKDYEIALNSFYKIADSKKYARIVPFYISQIFYNQKKYKKVITYGENQLESNPKLVYKNEISHVIGKSYFQQGEYQKAVKLIEAYIAEAEAVGTEDQYQLAYAHYQLHEYDQAIQGFENLNFLEDSLGQNALYHLGHCYLKNQFYEKARNAYLSASKMEYDPFIQEMSAFNYAKLSKELHYQDISIKALHEFTLDFPESIYVDEAKQLLSELFFETKNYVDAIRVIQTIQNKSPKIRSIYQKLAYYRAIELYNDRKGSTALLYFDIANENPIDKTIQALCFFWKGQYYFEMEDYVNSITCLNNFLSLNPSANQLPDNVSIEFADYTMGYAYFNRELYVKAITYFNKAKQIIMKQSNYSNQELKTDVLLRLGDCYFLAKNYQQAKANYQEVIDNKFISMDYALLQKAIIHGLETGLRQKVTLLTQLKNQYPMSIYIDDAMYELGVTHIRLNEYDKGIQVLEQLVTAYPNSNYVARSYLELGLISYNQKDDDKAITYYKNVIEKYGNTTEADVAILNLKDIYISQGNADAYVQYVKDYAHVTISISEQDSLSYLAAESMYSKGDCKLAIINFTDYINKFEDGAFLNHAHFYRGECLSREKQYEKAVIDYEYIIKQQQNVFTEKALAKAAEILRVMSKKCEVAYAYYEQLLRVAKYKENKHSAYIGLIHCGFDLKRYHETIRYVKEIKNATLLNEEEAGTTYLLAGKSHLALNEIDSAKSYLQSTIQVSKNQDASEAKYLIAETLYQEEQYDSAKTICLDIIQNTPNHEYWVISSYILIADMYAKSNNVFQAKATLKSIVENYDKENELKQKATEKLETLEKQEAEETKIETDKDKIIPVIKLDTIGDE